jgi:hypothetical protein
VKTLWFKGARDGKEKEERRLQVVSAENAFKILTEILDNKIKERDVERNLLGCYELPGYPYYQADASGYIRALEEVKSLLNLKE